MPEREHAPTPEHTPDYTADFGEYTVNLTRDGQTVAATVLRRDEPLGTVDTTTAYTDLAPHWIDIARDALATILTRELDAIRAAAQADTPHDPPPPPARSAPKRPESPPPTE